MDEFSGTALGETLTGIDARFDHVAHAVPSIADVLPIYRDLLGGVPVSGGFNPWAGHLAVMFAFDGQAKLELLEPTQRNPASIGRFLRENPRGGLHHVTFKVHDIHVALDALQRAGFTPVATMTELENWQETFLHPRDTHGVLIQLAHGADGLQAELPEPIEALLERAEQMRQQNGNRIS